MRTVSFRRRFFQISEIFIGSGNFGARAGISRAVFRPGGIDGLWGGRYVSFTASPSSLLQIRRFAPASAGLLSFPSDGFLGGRWRRIEQGFDRLKIDQCARADLGGSK